MEIKMLEGSDGGNPALVKEKNISRTHKDTK